MHADIAVGAPVDDHGGRHIDVGSIERREFRLPVVRFELDEHGPQRADGSRLEVLHRGIVEVGPDGRRHGYLILQDITAQREAEQRIQELATRDELTGLVNRREFERRLTELVNAAKTDGRQHGLLYLDLDNFKTVNDTCGHAAGDEMLRQLTTVMQARMRGSDTLARLGGDEFGVILEQCPLEQAVRIANGMREAVREFRFIWEDKTFGVGISAGLVGIDGSESTDRVLAAADRICYEAKTKGRDRVQVYRPEHQHEDTQNAELSMVSQINHAFEFGSFRLYRQEIVALNAADGNTPHYEILVRMLDRDGHPVPPSAFMPTAERYNLLGSIERWVISSLVEFLAAQCESGAIPRDSSSQQTSAFYAVNLSGASINDASFTDFMRKLINRFNLPRGLLCFEVTETTAIANLTKAAALLKAGAKRVVACCVHGVFSGDARKRLNESMIEEVIVSDTIAHEKGASGDKVTVLSVAPLFAEAIRRIHSDDSISSLFR